MNVPDEAPQTSSVDREFRFDFGLPFYIGLLFLSGLLAITIYDPDILEFLYLVVAAPAALLFFWADSSYNTGVQRQSSLLVLLVCCLTSWLIVRSSYDVRSEARWLVSARHYKRKVLAQADLLNGQFKHIEWDGWGWAGVGNTVLYLVFDPNDSLSSARGNVAGKYKGIPCEVPSVHRLEKHWYTVIFYTDASWGSCT